MKSTKLEIEVQEDGKIYLRDSEGEIKHKTDASTMNDKIREGPLGFYVAIEELMAEALREYNIIE